MTANICSFIESSTEDEILKSLVSTPKDLWLTMNGLGESPLHLAAKLGMGRLVSFLLENGVEPDFKGHWAGSPLSYALKSSEGLACAEILLKKGADPRYVRSDGVTVLMSTIESGNMSGVKILIEKLSKGDLDKRNKEKETALIVAAIKNKPEAVALLCEAGASLNGRDAMGITALMWSCFLGNLKVCEVLLKFGARTDLKDNEGVSAMASACQNGQVDCLELLIKKGVKVNVQKGTPPLIFGVESEDIQIVETLLANGANVNGVDSAGYTPLMMATIQNDIKMLDFLLKNGADHTVRNSAGESAFEIALKSSDNKCLPHLSALMEKDNFSSYARSGVLRNRKKI